MNVPLYTERLTLNQLEELQRKLKKEKVDLFTIYSTYNNGEYVKTNTEKPFNSQYFGELYKNDNPKSGVFLSRSTFAHQILQRPEFDRAEWGYLKLEDLTKYKGLEYIELLEVGDFVQGEPLTEDCWSDEICIDFDHSTYHVLNDSWKWSYFLFRRKDLKRIEEGIVHEGHTSNYVEIDSEFGRYLQVHASKTPIIVKVGEELDDSVPLHSVDFSAVSKLLIPKKIKEQYEDVYAMTKEVPKQQIEFMPVEEFLKDLPNAPEPVDPYDKVSYEFVKFLNEVLPETEIRLGKDWQNITLAKNIDLTLPEADLSDFYVLNSFRTVEVHKQFREWQNPPVRPEGYEEDPEPEKVQGFTCQVESEESYLRRHNTLLRERENEFVELVEALEQESLYLHAQAQNRVVITAFKKKLGI